MIALQSPRRRAVLADLVLALSIAVFIAGLSVALAWIAPLELVLPRPL